MPCRMSHQQKQLTLWELTPEPLPDGQKMAKSRSSKPRQDKDVTILPNISNKNPVQLSLLDLLRFVRQSLNIQPKRRSPKTNWGTYYKLPRLRSYHRNWIGLNFKRRKLNAILEGIISGDIQCLVVAHKDRLARFGFDLIEWLCEKFDCKLVVLYQQKYSPQAELVQDVLSVVHCFSSRLYGLRKYENNSGKTRKYKSKKRHSQKLTAKLAPNHVKKNSGLSW